MLPYIVFIFWKGKLNLGHQTRISQKPTEIFYTHFTISSKLKKTKKWNMFISLVLVNDS